MQSIFALPRHSRNANRDLSRKSTFLYSLQPNEAAADQSLLAGLGLNIPISASASAVSTESATPIQFAYNTPNVVKDSRKRH
jgi:hypothetical protein